MRAVRLYPGSRTPPIFGDLQPQPGLIRLVSGMTRSINRSDAARPFAELLDQLRAMQPVALRLVFDWLAPNVAGYLRALS